MKKIFPGILYCIAILSLLTLVSCNHNGNNPEEEQQSKMASALVGTWNLITITDTRSVSIGSEEVDVYVVFEADAPAATKADLTPKESTGTFTLYQMLGTGRFRTFRGTWSLMGALLTGVYSNGTPWGAEYAVTLDDNDTRLTLAAPTETCVYTRATLPSGL